MIKPFMLYDFYFGFISLYQRCLVSCGSRAAFLASLAGTGRITPALVPWCSAVVSLRQMNFIIL